MEEGVESQLSQQVWILLWRREPKKKNQNPVAKETGFTV